MSRTRMAALGFVVAAVLLRLLITGPFRDQRSDAAAESRRLYDQSRAVRARLLAIERRKEALRRAAFSVEPDAPRDPLASARRAVLACLDETRLSGVKLEVHAGPRPAAATVRLSAVGSTDEAVRLTGRLIERRLLFNQVRVTPGERGLLLEVEAITIESGP